MSKPKNPDLFDGGIDGACTDVTLRDLFAAFALAGLLGRDEKYLDTLACSRAAYAAADYMLAEREKTG